MDASQLAWMAAVVELKGRIRRSETKARSTPLFRLVVEVRQLHVAERLARMTGTKVSYSAARPVNSTTSRRQCTEHCPEPHQHVLTVMPAIGRWDVSGVGLIIVLNGLEPYLDPVGRAGRDEVVTEALTCVPLSPRNPGRAMVERAIVRLAGLGWDIPEELIPDGMPNVGIVEALSVP